MRGHELLIAAMWAPAVLAFGAMAIAPLGPQGAPASAFPKPDRPVADIVSPIWDNRTDRDAAREVLQIAARLDLKPGMSVVDIGAGSGYDTLRLSPIVGPRGHVIGEDIMANYLQTLQDGVREQHLTNVSIDLGEPHDPRLQPGSVDAAIMIHMYHEIIQPYALLYNLASAFKPGGRLGIEELDRPTRAHGTPPTLLTCELKAVGYSQLSMAPLAGGIGYFAVFAPPAPDARPAPSAIKPCHP
jgi:ubiquinone/menaquinone biosynthesis C-methylase UbiE